MATPSFFNTIMPEAPNCNVGNDTVKWDDGWFSDTIHAAWFKADTGIESPLYNVETFIVTTAGYFRGDNIKLYFGAGDDASLYYDGTNLVIDCQEVGSGDCRFISGDVGIGKASGSAIEGKLGVYQVSNDTAANVIGINTDVDYGSSGSGNMSNYVYGLRFNAQTDADWDGDSSSIFQGLHGVVNHYGSGTLANTYGAQFETHLRADGGDITNAYGVATRFSDASSVGAFTNCYGVYVRDVNVGTTLNYAIYTNDGHVYFKDKVGINTLVPVEALQVGGNVFLVTNNKLLLGTSKRSALYYDGTDLIISPQDGGGSGIVDVIGTLQTDGYNSSDGTAGATADVAVAKVGGGTRTLHFKDGLYTSYTDS